MSDTVLQSRVLVEKTTMRPSSSAELHVVVDLTARGAPVEAVRPRLSVVFCIDASSSMTGAPLAQVLTSVEMIVDLLDERDEVGLVAFASEASLVAPPTALTPNGRAMLKRRASSIRALGNTNLDAGLLTGLGAFGARVDDARRVLIVLSDGRPNRGRTTLQELSTLVADARGDVGVVTLGYGSAHHADLLHGIARAAGGSYWFIPEPSEARSEFARALGAQGDVVCASGEVALMPADGVEIVRILNVEKSRFSRDGLVVPVPDLRDGQNHKVVLRLAVRAPDDAGPFAPVTVVVRHRPVGARDVVSETLTPVFGVAEREPQDVVEAVHAVLLAEAEEARGKARADADVGRFDGAARILRAVLARLEAAPGYVVNDGSPLSEAVEQLVDEVTAYERKPSATEYMEFRSTALGVDVAQGAKHIADVVSNSQLAARLRQATTTEGAIGTLVVVDKQGNEHGRVPLAGELVIGRVEGNDIVLPRGNVSKRHARVVVRDGKPIVVDLKTTNGTFVNGVRVSSPRPLSARDTIYVGDFSLRFEPDASPMDAGPRVDEPSGAAPAAPRASATTNDAPMSSGDASRGERDVVLLSGPFPAPDVAPSSLPLPRSVSSEAAEHLAPTRLQALVFVDDRGNEYGRIVIPAKDAEFTIGRAPTSDVVLPRPDVARQHARVVVRDGKVILVDLGSQNGTFVGDKRLKGPVVLRTGDRVRVALCQVLVVGNVAA